MSGMDFEYAIKKDVRNNPIVREVDEARQRQLLQSVVIGGLLSLVILFSAWQRFALLGHGDEMQRMQQERAEQEEVNRQLRLEIETLRWPARTASSSRPSSCPPSAARSSIVGATCSRTVWTPIPSRPIRRTSTTRTKWRRVSAPCSMSVVRSSGSSWPSACAEKDSSRTW